MRQLQQKTPVPLVQSPAQLNVQLRNYQLEGVSWLLVLRRFGFGGCLADDMGLGKTIQFIAYLLASRQEPGLQPALLICPTSVLGNWQKELERFAPTLRVYLHYGPNRVKGNPFAETVRDYDLCFLSIPLLILIRRNCPRRIGTVFASLRRRTSKMRIPDSLLRSANWKAAITKIRSDGVNGG